MLKLSLTGMCCLLIVNVFPSAVLAQGEHLTSLRGSNPIDEESSYPSIKRVIKDREPVERNYMQQPPLIPHTTKGYKINLKFNKCLTCHSWANYKQSGATKVSQTHFADRHNDVLSNVAPRRYFCTQCHVPQVDSKPIVENTFLPVNSVKSSR